MPGLSTEVALVAQTKGCRDCGWFWRHDPPPYGPFPSYDFKTTFPAEVKRSLRVLDSEQPWLEARATKSFEQIEPAILHGCRKAPIMTLGINPNMSGFFVDPERARAAYPRFADAKSYAYYYRYRTTFQERLTAETQTQHWNDQGEATFAAQAGVTLSVRRGEAHRWALIEVLYDDGQRASIELTWDGRSVPVIYATREQRFEKGQLLASVRAEAPAGDLQLMAARDKYLARFQPILTRLCELANWPRELSVGEDVALGDLVACASPGWDSERYGIPVDHIASLCAGQRRFILRQVLQTQPRVLVFVGKTALQMFSDNLPAIPWLRELTERYRDDTFGLFRHTIEHPQQLEITGEGIAVRARVLCVPHFSYDDNYVPQLQFSEAEWASFESTHAADARGLRAAKRVRLPRDGFIGVDWSGVEPLLGQLTPQGLRVLIAHAFDPSEMIAQALYEEVKGGRIDKEPTRTRLARAPGGCDFCHNELWQFEGGCAYPSVAGPSVPDAVSTQLAKSLGKAEPTGSPPDAVRVWLGRRRPELQPEDFANKLRDVFVPATVQMLQPLGLRAYLPTLLSGESQDLPHEIALVFYESQRAYNESRDTPLGRAYGELHDVAFDRATWRSSFPVPYQGELKDDTAYYLLHQPASWQLGSTEIYVARVAANGGRTELAAFLSELQQRPPLGLDGYIAMLRGDVWFRWAHFSGRRDDTARIGEPGLATIIHESRSQPHRLGEDAAHALNARVPLQPDTTLSLQFRALG